MKLVFKLVSLKQTFTIDRDELQTKVFDLKQFIFEQYGIPINRQRLIEGGKVMKERQTIAEHMDNVNLPKNNSKKKLVRSSITKKPKSCLNVMVLGQVPKDGELVDLTITDIISFIISFLTLQEVRVCKLVNKTWCQLAIEGSDQNFDRFCILPDGKTVYDMLLFQTAYQLEKPILNLKELMDCNSIYSHRNIVDTNYNVITNGEAKLPSSVYTGIEFVFYKLRAPVSHVRMNELTDFLVCVQITTGKQMWQIDMTTLKPIDILHKQRSHLDRMKMRRRRQANDPNAMVDSDEEDNTTVSEYEDKLMMVLYDKSTKYVFVQYDTFIAVLHASDGSYKGVIDPDERLESFTSDDTEPVMSKISAPIAILGSVLLLPLHNDYIVLVDKISLKPFYSSSLKLVLTKIATVLQPYDPDDNQQDVSLLCQIHDGSYRVLRWNNQEATISIALSEKPKYLTNQSILSNDLTVYDVETGTRLIRTNEISTNLTDTQIFGVFENSATGLLEGYFGVSPADDIQIQDIFAYSNFVEPNRSFPFHPSTVNLLGIRRESVESYQGSRSKREVVLKEQTVLIDVWSTVIWFPKSDVCKLHTAISADRMFLVGSYISNYTEKAARIHMIDGHAVVDEEQMEEIEAVPTTVAVYALDSHTGSKKWYTEFTIDPTSTVSDVQVKSGTLVITTNKNASLEKIVVLSGHTGKIHTVL